MVKEKPETKRCKHCQTVIPYSAKVCPNCKKKQGGMLKWIIIVIVVALIAVAAASGGESEPKLAGTVPDNSQETSPQETQSETTNENAVNETKEEKEVFSLNEIAEMNHIQVTMTDYEESKGSEFNKPGEGNIFLLAEFEIVNDSDSEINVSSMLSFEAYADDYSLNYSVAAMLEKENSSQLDGTVAPGKKMKGVIGYEVPEDWKTVEIHFVDDVWSNNKFKFQIKK